MVSSVPRSIGGWIWRLSMMTVWRPAPVRCATIGRDISPPRHCRQVNNGRPKTGLWDLLPANKELGQGMEVPLLVGLASQ